MMGIVTLRLASDFLLSEWGAVFVERVQSVDQYSDHGQSVTSSFEYCDG